MTLKYLEDFMDYAEDLPQIFREKMTKVRELDLDVNNRQDHIKRIKLDMRQIQRDRKLTSREAMKKMVNEINKEHDLIIARSVEKVNIVAGLEKMMERYFKHLCGETEKFKMELEADNPGITTKLEARAMQELQARTKVLSPLQPISTTDSSRKADNQRKPLIDSSRKSNWNFSKSDNAPDPAQNGLLSRKLPSVSATVSSIPKNTNKPGLDASVQTHFEKTSSRPSSDRKLSFNGFPTVDDAKTFIDKFQQLTSILNNDTEQSQSNAPVPTSRQRSRRLASLLSQRSSSVCALTTPAENLETDVVEEEQSKVYCVCKTKTDSSIEGYMVGCDNPQCLLEWFHPECVGIKRTEVAAKHWYCPDCRPHFSDSVRNINQRKNVHSNEKGLKK